MFDLASASAEDFETALNRRFRLHSDGEAALALELVSVDRRGAPSPQLPRGQAFSLVFRGSNAPVLEQRIYRLEPEGESAQAFELFLVPIGPDAQGMCYEAVFA